MGEYYRAQWSVLPVGDNTEDVVVNTWYFHIPGVLPLSHMPDIETALSNFWNTCDGYLSNYYASRIPTLKWYDMADPPQRVPVRTVQLPQLQTGTDRLPSELALCLSYRANFQSGVRNSSRRGRVYLGPFASNALNNTTGRPDATMRGNFAAAGQNLLNASVGDADWTWVQYSPTRQEFSPVVEGWVDDAWDVQRRRGIDPTTRSTFS